MPDWLCWVLIAVMLLVSGLFSASENAFSNCNKYHFKVLADQGKVTPRIIVHLSERFETTLVSVLVGNNIVQTIMSFMSAVLFYNLANQNGWGEAVEALLSTVVMAFLVYVVSDTVPKILSKAIPNRMAYLLAWPDFVVSIILFPVIIVFRGLLFLVHKVFKIKDENVMSRESFIEKADEAVQEDNLTNEEERLFEPNELDILKRAFSFDKISAKKVLTPIERVTSLNIDGLTAEKLNDLILNSKFSRFPVYEGDRDNVIGTINLNAYFKEYMQDPHLEIRSCLIDPVFVKEIDKVDDIFEKLNREKTHLAIVQGTNGQVAGIITMDDILDELMDLTSQEPKVAIRGIAK